jgi:hypothetical protein
MEAMMSYTVAFDIDRKNRWSATHLVVGFGTKDAKALCGHEPVTKFHKPVGGGAATCIHCNSLAQKGRKRSGKAIG